MANGPQRPPQTVTQLAQQISEPFPDWLNRVIDTALLRHMANCPVAPRVAKLEIRIAWLVGLMVGSGCIGGVVGALAAPFLNGTI